MRGLLRRGLRAFGVDVAPVAHQSTLATHLLRVLGRLRVDCVLDVGGHHGEYAGALRRIGYRGDIVSFEPLEEAYDVLVRRAARDPRWTARRCALSSQDGSATLRVASGTGFSSFHPLSAYAPTRFPRLSVVRTESVPVRRLDGVLAEIAPAARAERLFVKLDTQGHDLQVLEGAGGALDRVVALQSEASVKPLYDAVPDLGEHLGRLRALGFEPSGFFPVTRDADDLRLVEVDVVAVRRP